MIFGVRSTSERFCEWLDEALGAYRIDEETDAYFSVVVGDGSEEGGSREYHILYRSSQKIVRTFHLPTVARSLVGEIESLSFSKRSDAIYLDFGVIASNGTTGLIPTPFGWSLTNLGRRVDRLGFRLPASPSVALDLESGTVIPTPATLEVPDQVFGDLIGNGSREPDRLVIEEPIVPDFVCVFSRAAEPLSSVSRGWALARLAGGVYNLKGLGQSALATLTQTVNRTASYGIGAVEPKETLKGLATTLRSA